MARMHCARAFNAFRAPGDEGSMHLEGLFFRKPNGDIGVFGF